MMRPAAWMRARCENACGKFPRWRERSTSNSSAYRPSGEEIRSRRSIRLVACSISPTAPNAETSQNEQIRKVPSLPDNPSSVSSVR